MSADPETEYFSDGVTEDIITQLSKIRGLRVMSRTSTMRFKKHTQSLREIGQTLGVSHILEGSVRRAGNKVRIVAQLIDAQSDEHLWADTYDRELSDIFAIQLEVATQIADKCRRNSLLLIARAWRKADRRHGGIQLLLARPASLQQSHA